MPASGSMWPTVSFSCLLNVLCPSPGSRFCPWSAHRLPTSCPVQIGSRVPISTACSNATCRFGKRVGPRASSGTASRRGDVGGSPTFRRGSFLLSSLTADGMQPCLCHPKRHRFLARKAELGSIPPHSVKHNTDAPGQGNGELWPRVGDGLREGGGVSWGVTKPPGLQARSDTP